MTIRPCQNHSDRQTMTFGGHRSFLPGFGAIGRVWSGIVPTAGRLHTAPINAEVGQVETDDVVEGLNHDLLEAGEDPRGDPFVAASSQRGRGDFFIGVFGVGATEDEARDELVEDDSVRHTRSVTSERVNIIGYWQESFELAEEGVDD